MERLNTVFHLQRREITDFDLKYTGRECQGRFVPGFSWDSILSYGRMPTKVNHDGCINTIRFTTDGDLMITGSDDQTVKLWNVCDDFSLKSAIGTWHRQNIFCADICPSANNFVLSCAADGTLRMNNIEGNHIAERILHRTTGIM